MRPHVAEIQIGFHGPAIRTDMTVLISHMVAKIAVAVATFAGAGLVVVPVVPVASNLHSPTVRPSMHMTSANPTVTSAHEQNLTCHSRRTARHGLCGIKNRQKKGNRRCKESDRNKAGRDRHLGLTFRSRGASAG